MSPPETTLVLYWLKDGGSGNFPVPPLDTITTDPLIQTVVNLFAAPLALAGDGTVGVEIPAAIRTQFDTGQTKALQARGVSVVLTIVNGANNLGWSTLTATQNGQLADSIATLVQQTGIDGIDIDDEGVGGQPANFNATVIAIRQALPAIIISNAIYDPQDYEKFSQFPDLIKQMTYCSTMVYGNSYDGILSNLQWFHSAGIAMNQLCAGVQAGPEAAACNNPGFTSLATARRVAQWAGNNCRGVMLFTFSQDIVAFTGCPQHGSYPAPGDHAWQQTITEALVADRISAGARGASA
jgi:hypothetical protein